MEQGPLAETSRLDEEAVVRAPRGFPGLAGGIPVGPLFVVRVWSPHPSLRVLTLTPGRTSDTPLCPPEALPLTPNPHSLWDPDVRKCCLGSSRPAVAQG